MSSSASTQLLYHTPLKYGQYLADRGTANGFTPLDSNGKIPDQFIPDSIVSGFSFKGDYDASTNSPDLATDLSQFNNGHVYRVSVAGSTDLSGITDWGLGDFVVFSEGSWLKIDNTQTVTGVNGRTGSVQVTMGDMGDGTVLERHLATDSVTRDKIANFAVHENQLDSNAVSVLKLAPNSVAVEKIRDGAVTEPKLADVSVSSAKLKNLSVTNTKLGDSAVTGGKIAANTITYDNMAANSVRTTAVLDASITESKLAGGAVTADKLGLVAGELPGHLLTDQSVSGGKLQSSSVTSDHILDGTIQTVDLADASVTAAKLADGAIDSQHFVDSSVSMDQLAGRFVTKYYFPGFEGLTIKMEDGDANEVQVKLSQDAHEQPYYSFVNNATVLSKATFIIGKDLQGDSFVESQYDLDAQCEFFDQNGVLDSTEGGCLTKYFIPDSVPDGRFRQNAPKMTYVEYTGQFRSMGLEGQHAFIHFEVGVQPGCEARLYSYAHRYFQK